MSAETILKMIETVSPDDTAKLDEIDARFHVYKLGRVYGSHVRQHKDHPIYDQLWVHTADGHEVGMVSHYATSRDALKENRPKDWIPHLIPMISGDGTTTFSMTLAKARHPDDDEMVQSPPLPTEELAELHAIIQAIEYERTK